MQHDERRPAARITEGTFASVVQKFMSPANPRWMKYADATRELWARQLIFASRSDLLGPKSIKQLRPALVQAYLDGLADTPAKQVVALSAIRALEKWALVRDIFPAPIAYGCEAEGSDNGHVPWNETQVQLAEQHAKTFLARIITMAANTGQRGSDLVKMRWTDIEVYRGRAGINVLQQKTKKQVWVPFTQDLQNAMETWERRPGFILLNYNDQPLTREVLSKAWERERDRNPALAPLRLDAMGPDATEGLVLHGLRGTACVRLLRAGANTRQISDMVGMSEQMVARYTRFSDQRDNATAAVGHLDRTSGDVVPFKREG